MEGLESILTHGVGALAVAIEYGSLTGVPTCVRHDIDLEEGNHAMNAALYGSDVGTRLTALTAADAILTYSAGLPLTTNRRRRRSRESRQ